MPNTNYLIASPCNHHSPLAITPRHGTSSLIPMSPRRDLDRGSRHIVSWAPVTFFFFLDMFFFFYYTNEYQWFKFSRTYVWTWQGQQGRGKGLRCVPTHLVCLFLVRFFFFYCIFFLIANLFIIIYFLVTTTITATASTTHFPSLSTTWLVTGGINELVWQGSEMANGRGMGPEQHLLLFGP